jgi:deazaflavin-dependent oxidoreductase (nitroreductase family)
MDPFSRPNGLDHPVVPKLMRWMSRAHVALYRATGGRLGARWRVGCAFPHGVPLFLLTTVGKKTGLKRTTPLLFLEDADRYVGSQGGLPTAPHWFGNLVANPDVEVQIGRRVEKRRARVATPVERQELWPRLVAHYADFEAYQAWTTRTIPLAILERA